MDHVGNRVPILFTLTYHSWNIIPRVSIILHSFDDFNDSVDIGNVFLNVLSFDFVNVLFLLELFDSLILVIFNLTVFLPGYSFKIFLFLILSFFVVHKVLCYSLIKSRRLFAWIVEVFYIFVRRKLEVIFLPVLILSWKDLFRLFLK
jgi:hypothetical protein